MSDGGRLFRAILEAPGDDLRRLVYADWLEENGQAGRAEFIRVQVELAAMDERGDGVIDPEEGHTCHEWPCPVCALVDRCEALRRRERELFLRGPWPTATWLPLSGGATRYRAECPRVETAEDALTDTAFGERFGERFDRLFTFRRGFVAEVSLTLADFYGRAGEGCGPRLVLAAPLEAVRLTDRHATPEDDTDFGWFKRDPDGQFSGEEAELPADLWDRLRGGTVRRDRQYGAGTWRNYATRTGSATALSAACVRWARAAAGLP